MRFKFFAHTFSCVTCHMLHEKYRRSGFLTAEIFSGMCHVKKSTPKDLHRFLLKNFIHSYSFFFAFLMNFNAISFLSIFRHAHAHSWLTSA